jgi:hypothetical protein
MSASIYQASIYVILENQVQTVIGISKAAHTCTVSAEGIKIERVKCSVFSETNGFMPVKDLVSKIYQTLRSDGRFNDVGSNFTIVQSYRETSQKKV